MLILGLLLLVAAGVLIAGVVTGNTATVHLDVLGYHQKLSAAELFIVGAITGLAVLLGLLLFLSGMRRSGRKRRQVREERKIKRQREDELQAENARLARELEQQRRASPSGPTVATGGPAAPAPAPAPPAGPVGRSSSGDSANPPTVVSRPVNPDDRPGATTGSPPEAPSTGAHAPRT